MFVFKFHLQEKYALHKFPSIDQRGLYFQIHISLTCGTETSCKDSLANFFCFFPSLGVNLIGFYLLRRGGGASLSYNTTKSSWPWVTLKHNKKNFMSYVPRPYLLMVQLGIPLWRFVCWKGVLRIVVLRMERLEEVAQHFQLDYNTWALLQGPWHLQSNQLMGLLLDQLRLCQLDYRCCRHLVMGLQLDQLL